MKNRRLFIFLLFSFFIHACGQQGPLFMPIEDQPVETGEQQKGAH